MYDFETVAQMLDEIADAVPFELYRELNGGISVVPELKIHPLARHNDLFILGEYIQNSIGNSIVIYYGSVMRVYSHLDRDSLYKELEHILHHELRHHNEYLAGTDDLELWDDEQITQYLKNQN